MHEQKEGAAKGSQVTLILANLFVEDFEANANESLSVKHEFWSL